MPTPKPHPFPLTFAILEYLVPLNNRKDGSTGAGSRLHDVFEAQCRPLLVFPGIPVQQFVVHADRVEDTCTGGDVVGLGPG